MKSVSMPVLICALLYSFDTFSADSQNDHKFKVVFGTDVSSGNYGHKKETDILYFPLTFKYKTPAWQYSATFSYLKITGPGNIVGAGDGSGIPINQFNESKQPAQRKNTLPGKGKKGKAYSVEGMGDLLLGTIFTFNSQWDMPFYLDGGLKLKIPTADEEKGLGTGEADLSFNLDIEKTFYSQYLNPFTLFGQLGYKYMGSSESLPLNNISFYRLGLDFHLHHKVISGITYDYRTAMSGSQFSVKELLVYLDWKIDNNWSINGYAVKGFSDGSPERAYGLQLTHHYH